jgi:threonine synthase
MPTWISTRDPLHRATFAEAARASMAPGGGLYVPATVPTLDPDALLALPFADRSVCVLQSLLDDVDRDLVERAVREALDFPVPCVPVGDRLAALELFHGPTLAFKDFGARFLARILSALDGGRERLVLTATSGDTGAAVAHAFWRVPGFRVVVLYPNGRISRLQEKQFCTLGDNVQTYAVDGSFDDCQAMVKACFDDAVLRERRGLVSANSIHVARLVAQTTYYWEAAAQRPSAVVSVPSGNFGNLCAGILALRQGAPIRALVAATNANRTVPDYLDGGPYAPRPSVATPANAMDVGAPSNFERVRWLYGDDRAAMARELRWGAVTDAGIAAEMQQTWTRDAYLLDPHGAVAASVLRASLAPDERGVFLATAHPAKFLEVVRSVLGFDPPVPASLAERATIPVLSGRLPVDAAKLASVI